MAIAGCRATAPVAVEHELDVAKHPAAFAFSEDLLFNLGVGKGKVDITYLDLDHDGVSECFLGVRGSMGQAGGSHLVLKSYDRGRSYYILGDFGSFPEYIHVLPLAEDGSMRFRYAHRAYEKGVAVCTWTYDGLQFVIVDREMVQAGDSGTDAGRARMRELFPDR